MAGSFDIQGHLGKGGRNDTRETEMKALFRKLFRKSEEHKKSMRSLEEVQRELERFSWEIDIVQRTDNDNPYN